MRGVLLIASITLREAMRRRVWLGVLVILVGLALIDFTVPLEMERSPRFGGDSAERLKHGLEMAQYFGARIMLFFSSIMAILLGASQVSAEVERGTLATILAKPIRRVQVLLGKWLGLVAFGVCVILFCYSVNWLVLSLRYGFGAGASFNVPALLVMLLYPTLYGTITMAWSSFAGMALSLLLTAMIYAATFVGDGIVKVISQLTDNKSLKDLELLSRWVIPHQRLGEWLFSLEKGLATTIVQAISGVPEGTLFDKLYIFIYIIAFFWFAHLVFSRRDVQ